MDVVLDQLPSVPAAATSTALPPHRSGREAYRHGRLGLAGSDPAQSGSWSVRGREGRPSIQSVSAPAFTSDCNMN